MIFFKKKQPPTIPPRPSEDDPPSAWERYLDARADYNRFFIERGARAYRQASALVVIAFIVIAVALWSTQHDLDVQQADQQIQRRVQTRDACEYRNAQSEVILAGARRLGIKLTPRQLARLGPEDCDKRVERLAP